MKKTFFLLFCALFMGIQFAGATSLTTDVAHTTDNAFLQEMLALETYDPGDPPPQEGLWCTSACAGGWAVCMIACSSDLACEEGCGNFFNECMAYCNDPVGAVIWGPGSSDPTP